MQTNYPGKENPISPKIKKPKSTSSYTLRGYGGQAIGAKEGNYMKKCNVKYTAESMGKLKIIRDFLPSPENIVLKDDTVNVTLSLTKESIEFFKKEAASHQTQYQKMIRGILDRYAHHFSKSHKC